MDKERISQIKKSSEIFRSCITARGAMIDLSISTEDIMTDIIAWSFFPTYYDSLDTNINEQLDEKGIILKSSILRSLEYHEKIDVFQDIIKLTNPTIWASNKSLIKEIQKLLNDIRRFRNKLAHSPLDTSDESINKSEILNESGDYSFEILEYKKGKIQKHTISDETIKLQLGKLHRANYKLMQLWALLKNDPEDANRCAILADMSDEESKIVLNKLGLNED